MKAVRLTKLKLVSELRLNGSEGVCAHGGLLDAGEGCGEESHIDHEWLPWGPQSQLCPDDICDCAGGGQHREDEVHSPALDELPFFIVSDMWAPLLCATDMWVDLLTVSNRVRIIPLSIP
jgi:hypothetical protein